MSACISRHGEFSDHETINGGHVCTRCFALDEDGLLAALRTAEQFKEQYHEQWMLTEAELAKTRDQLRHMVESWESERRAVDELHALRGRIETLLRESLYVVAIDNHVLSREAVIELLLADFEDKS